MRDDQVLFSIDSGLHVVADHARWSPSEVEQPARVDLGLDQDRRARSDRPRAALGDKGYDSKSKRVAARQRGICPAIPYRSHTKDMPA
jgi:hypothetical protein